MVQPLEIASGAFGVLAVAGSAYQLFAGMRLRAFRPGPPASLAAAPGVTVLKPLHGDEPGLAEALQTLLDQDYGGEVQVILGLQDPADPALSVAEALRGRHPDRDVAVVVDPRSHGSNRKVSNLINMAGQARHEVVVLADSDISVPRDYLARVVVALEGEGVGVVTLAYYGEAKAGFWSRLAALGLTWQFLPSVVVGLSLGMAAPCMGSTIALRRGTLARIGGFEAFADVLADDYAIGAAVRAAGLKSVVPPLLVAHGCAERSLRELLAHELRWASTVRRIDPAGFAGSLVTYPLPLALICVLMAGGSPWSLAVLICAVAARLWLIGVAEKRSGSETRGWWLAPARDILSFAVFLGAFFVRVVEWRGGRFRVDRQGGLSRL